MQSTGSTVTAPFQLDSVERNPSVDAQPKKTAGAAKPTAKHFNALTGLRFLASMYVVLYHFGRVVVANHLGVLAPLIHGAPFALQFFFVLSGFVIGHSYLERDTPVRKFHVARLSRVFPLYVIALMLTLPSFIVESRHDPLFQTVATAITAPLLLQALLPITALTWNYPAWSVSVEVFFYLLFPSCRQWLRARSTQYYIGVIAICWACLVVPSALYCWMNPDHLQTMLGAAHESFESVEYTGWLGFLLHNPIFHVAEFVAGLALSCVFVRFTSFSKTVWNCLFWLASSALIAIVFWSGHLPYPVVHNGLLLPILCALILCCSTESVSMNKLLGSRFLVLMGNASYGIYILQYPAYLMFKTAYLGISTGHPQGMFIFTSAGTLVVFLSFLCLISLAVTRFVEPSLIPIARNLFDKVFSEPAPRVPSLIQVNE